MARWTLSWPTHEATTCTPSRSGIIAAVSSSNDLRKPGVRLTAVVEGQVQEACRAARALELPQGGIGGLRVRSHRHRQGDQAGRVADDEGDVLARDPGARHKPAPGHARGTDKDDHRSSAFPGIRPEAESNPPARRIKYAICPVVSGVYPNPTAEPNLG